MIDRRMSAAAERNCVFCKAARISPFVAAALIILMGILTITSGPAKAAGEAKDPKNVAFSFDGPFGTFDRDAVRRGFAVYKQLCSACHSMEFMRYRMLGQPGGPEFSEAEVKAIAAEYSVMDGPDDFGEMFDRPGLPKDPFIAPFPNEQAARAANGGAYPPDLSVITKARAGGADYVYSILTGYQDPPEDVEIAPGMYYNPYFSGGQIAMAPPIMEQMIPYTDGSPETVSQYAKDVVTFLHWAAEPKLEERKTMGFQVLVFLVIFAGLLYFTMRKVWADVH